MTEREQEAARRDALKFLALFGGLVAALLNPLNDSVSWDPVNGDFNVDGKVVSARALLHQVVLTELKFKKVVQRYTAQLQRGEITLESWRLQMNRLVSSAHLIMGGLAAGSLSAAINSDELESRVDEERKFLSNFAVNTRRSISNDRQLSDAQFMARAQSYTLAATVTFGIVLYAVKKSLGYDEAMRQRRAAESCVECVEFSDFWMPVSKCPSIGSLLCGGYCKCFIIYRKSGS